MIKRVGIDIDGVLTDGDSLPWEMGVVDYFGLEYKEGLINTSEGNVLMEKYNLTKDQLEEFFCNSSANIYKNIKVRPGAAGVIRDLKKEKELKVYIITARNFRKETESWLKENDIIYDKLILEPNKAKACTEHNIDVFIEDSPRNANAVNDSGVISFLLNNDYNESSDVREGVMRIYNLSNLCDFISSHNKLLHPSQKQD